MDRKSGPRSEQVLEMGATGMDPPRVEWKFFVAESIVEAFEFDACAEATN